MTDRLAYFREYHLSPKYRAADQERRLLRMAGAQYLSQRYLCTA